MSVEYSVDLSVFSKINMRLKIVEANDEKYQIMQYDTELVEDGSPYGIYRSLILDMENHLLCFSPPKSISLELFKSRVENTSVQNIIINEIIEGVMMNMFYDNRTQGWEIATKWSIGGNYWFYRTQYNIEDTGDSNDIKQLTFRQMFLEALNMQLNQNINDNAWINSLDKTYSYCFVLQHPANHFVLDIQNPTLYLVGVYELKENNIVLPISPDIFEQWAILQNAYNYDNIVIQFPKRYSMENRGTINTIKEVEDTVKDTDNYHLLGYMVYNSATGDRTVLENPKYKSVRELRGNQPNLQFHWLNLRKESESKQNKIAEFLSYFPRYSVEFQYFEKVYSEYIKETHNGYVAYYIKKEGNVVPKKYFPIVHRLHYEVRKPSNGQTIITKEVVRAFIDTLEPKKIIYYLNYNESINKEKADK